MRQPKASPTRRKPSGYSSRKNETGSKESRQKEGTRTSLEIKGNAEEFRGGSTHGKVKRTMEGMSAHQEGNCREWDSRETLKST